MTHKLSVFYQNVRGLRTKADEFLYNSTNSSHDIICITETWLCDGISVSSYFNPSYTVYRRDRDYLCTGQTMGGGVLIATKVSVASHRRFDLETYSECVWIEIKASDGFNYLIGTYYFPPLFDETTFIEHFESLGKQIDFDKFRVQIYGDFNLPGVEWSLQALNNNTLTARKAFSLLSFINLSGLEQLNSIPNCAGNILDLVLSNVHILSLCLASDPLVQVDKFHPPLIVQLSLPWKSRISSKPLAYSFLKGDYLGLYKYIETFDWSNVLAMSDVDRATETLTTIVKDAIDTFVPKRSTKPSKYPEWFSRDLKCYLVKKEHFHRLYKKCGSSLMYTKFSLFRALAKKLFKRDKRMHLDSVENSLFRRPKTFWKFTKQHTRDVSPIICLRACSDNAPGYVSSPHEVADVFVDYFAKCFSDNQQSVLPEDKELICHDFLSSIRVDSLDIAEAIRKLKPKFSSGVDGVPGFVIKGCGQLFIPILKHIFNMSLSSGVFPSLWKKAVVVPILKGGDASVVANYRPVSLLCAFSKVFEIVVHSRMTFYFRQKITPLQHGFLKGRSVETNLCTFLDYCVPFVLNREQVDAIYFDLSKAFDKVSHVLLLSKLHLYGVCTELCNWFKSYLSFRSNSVRVADSYSKEFFSISGVPQGSILGPLLFSIFINDIASCVKNVELLLFADDIKLFKSVHCHLDCDLIQHDVSNIAQWCKQNQLFLNPLKTKVISLCRRRAIINNTYHLEGNPIERVSIVRDLGVFIDCGLTFKNHVSFVVSSAMKVLGVISRLTKHFKKPHCSIHLFQSLVVSRLEFASVIWNSISVTQALIIERVQKRFVRIVYDRWIGRRVYYDYECLLNRFSLKLLSHRRTVLDLVFLHKIINGAIDSSWLISKIHFHVPFRATRQLTCFDICSPCRVSPLSRLQTLYNSIVPPQVDITTPLPTFRCQLDELFVTS